MNKPAELQDVAVTPAALIPRYDLVIATQKTPFMTSRQDAPILWWKVAGRPRETPPAKCSLLDPVIQKRLADYELEATEARQGMVIRRYKKRQKELAATAAER